MLGSGLFRFFSGIAIFGRGLQWFCSCRACKFSGKVGNFLGEWLRFSLSIVWLRLLQAWVVKIFRKVAARIFPGGYDYWGGGGDYFIFGEWLILSLSSLVEMVAGVGG